MECWNQCESPRGRWTQWHFGAGAELLLLLELVVVIVVVNIVVVLRSVPPPSSTSFVSFPSRLHAFVLLPPAQCLSTLLQSTLGSCVCVFSAILLSSDMHLLLLVVLFACSRYLPRDRSCEPHAHFAVLHDDSSLAQKTPSSHMRVNFPSGPPARPFPCDGGAPVQRPFHGFANDLKSTRLAHKQSEVRSSKKRP